MKPTVLLVEDDRWMGECYLSWLQGFGYDVVWAHDSQSALNAFDEFKVSLVILDIMLPFANGVQLLNVLASHPDLAQIPVVVCSSMSPNGLEQQYGVKAVLNKTELTPKLMRQTLAGALSNATV